MSSLAGKIRKFNTISFIQTHTLGYYLSGGYWECPVMQLTCPMPFLTSFWILLTITVWILTLNLCCVCVLKTSRHDEALLEALYLPCSLAAAWLVAGLSGSGGLLTAATSLYWIPVEQNLAGDQNATWPLFMHGWQHPFPAGSLYEWWIKICGRCWLYCISGSQVLPSFSLLFTDECCWISATGSVRETENVPV